MPSNNVKLECGEKMTRSRDSYEQQIYRWAISENAIRSDWKQKPFTSDTFINPAETGFYYLNSRYYDPAIGRFLNADAIDVISATASSLTEKNLYAYCDNNPINFKDETGKFGVIAGKIAVALITQYATDIVRNMVNGEKGMDVFTNTSSIGTYVAAGVSAMVPGGDLVENFVVEGIIMTEKLIKGEQVELKSHMLSVVDSTIKGAILGRMQTKVSDFILSNNFKNYSTYAGELYKKHPGITQEQVRQRIYRDYILRKRIAGVSDFIIDVLGEVY